MKRIVRRIELDDRCPALPRSPADRERSACGWCDYQAVCGHEAGDPEHRESDMKFDEAIQLLDERYGELS